MTQTDLTLSPADIGLPRPSWRPGQWEIVYAIAESGVPHQILNAPTGFGKSLAYMGIAALTGWRVVIITATKSLQDQLMKEFGKEQTENGELIDVRGQSNYQCNAQDRPELGLGHFFRRGRYYSVREAPCRRGIQCPLRDGGCAYYDRVREASRSQVFVTNYDFWFRNMGKMGAVDLLVMDEAHQAPDELADFLSFRLTKEQRRMLKAEWPGGEEVKVWQDWADWAADRCASWLEQDGHDDRLVEMKMDLERMVGALGSGEWVIEHTPQGVSFDCIDPESGGRKHLWGSAKRTLLVSATVNMMTAKAIGLPVAEVVMRNGKSNFPVERRPVYVMEGAVRLNFRSTEGEKRMWVNLIDRIIDSRTDRKGIIHTTSFERARYLLENSRHKKLLLLNESKNTAATVASFKKASSGILVSPSLTTGWDFPYSQCQFQVIGKIPFPDLRTKAAKARNARNKEWSGYTAAQVIVQSAGRGMRSADDQCETFIVDGNFDWWWKGNRKFLPDWFQVALKWVGLSKLPVPPPKLIT